VYLENVHDVSRSGSTPVDHMSACRNQMNKTVQNYCDVAKIKEQKNKILSEKKV
jgi:hypothetical protein